MIPNLLSIAGSDPSGGAGIQADLKTFAALGCHGMAVITALTAQNTRGVSAVHTPPAAFVAEQIRMILDDIRVDAIKIGMLGSADVVEAVAATLRERRPAAVVLDPVLVATSGAILGDDAVIAAMTHRLFPIATLITPNLAEAARLLGRPIAPTRQDVERAALDLRAAGPAAWLIKGGHAAGATSDDFLLDDADGHWLSAPRVATGNTHGTGCTLSSAIAASLAKGDSVRQATARAKDFLGQALLGADALDVGQGPGPVDHFAAFR